MEKEKYEELIKKRDFLNIKKSWLIDNHHSFVELILFDCSKEDHLSSMESKYKNIPTEAVNELYIENGRGMFLEDFFGKLDQTKLVFTKELLSTEQVLAARRHPKERRTDNFEDLNKEEFFKHYSDNSIVDCWKKTGTWVDPIWLLKIAEIYILIEGHSRVASLVCANINKFCAEKHKCWVLESSEAQFSDLILRYNNTLLFPDLVTDTDESYKTNSSCVDKLKAT